MAVNVTYLLGAGASYEVLPLVKDIKGIDGKITKPGLANSINNLAGQFRLLPERVKSYDESLKDEIVGKLEELGKKSLKYSSPDTYIRSLWLKGNGQSEIENAKKILSFFLTAEQLSTEEPKLDSRYIPFLSSILENNKGKLQFPRNIKIVSWNYDFQIELALQHFLNIDLNKIQGHFEIIPSEYLTESPSVIHLNGVAGLMKNANDLTSFSRGVSSIDKYERLSEFLPIWKFLRSQYDIADLFSFAWELNETNHKRISMSEKVLSETEILVIIGYSFPFFNREIDNKLLASFIGDKQAINLKIYIQDPMTDDNQIEFLRHRFGIEHDLEIEPIKSVDQFFLPPGL